MLCDIILIGRYLLLLGTATGRTEFVTALLNNNGVEQNCGYYDAELQVVTAYSSWKYRAHQLK